jgi:hypothetical protein
VRILPNWLRYSDYNQSPPFIIEWVADVPGLLRSVSQPREPGL